MLAAATFSAGLSRSSPSPASPPAAARRDQPLVGLGGSLLAPGLRVLVLTSWLTSVLPMLGFASLAMLLLIAARNGMAGVLGTILVDTGDPGCLTLIGTGTSVHALLLASHVRRLARAVHAAPVLLSTADRLPRQHRVDRGVPDRRLGDPRRRDFAGTPSSRRSVGTPERAARLSPALAAGSRSPELGPDRSDRTRQTDSIDPTFSHLSLIQQRLLGRTPETTSNPRSSRAAAFAPRRRRARRRLVLHRRRVIAQPGRCRSWARR